MTAPTMTAPRVLGLEEARARVLALVNAPANALGPFRPAVAPGPDPRPGVRRQVPGVGASTPWGAEDRLWIQVPEHAWVADPAARAGQHLLFAGDDPSYLHADWRTPLFAPLAPPAWVVREDGGLALDCALEQGLTVRFRVLPGERMLELRFGVTNGSTRALPRTWVQFCSVFRHVETLASQEPVDCWFRLDGTLAHWGGAGQDLAWIERFRDPATGRVARGAFFQALVTGCDDPRYPPEHLQQADVMWLARTVDLPLLVKSAPDGRRHVVLYGPCARKLMVNLLSPCAHVDPVLDGIAPGETRWGVVYLLFLEGERAALVESLVALDRELRTTSGFRED